MKTLLWYLRTKLKLLLGRGVQKSYSQFGEDMIAAAILRGVERGMYVDVGAFDPVLYSNTYHFYQKGWNGLAIDPNISAQSKFALMRPRDTFVPVGIAESEGTLPYWKFNYGAYNTLDAKEKNTYLRDNSSLRIIETTRVRVAPLVAILKEHDIAAVDFLSIDAQGLDLQVLRSMGDILPKLIAIEIAATPEEMIHSEAAKFLVQKGYRIAGIAGLTLFLTNK